MRRTSARAVGFIAGGFTLLVLAAIQRARDVEAIGTLVVGLSASGLGVWFAVREAMGKTRELTANEQISIGGILVGAGIAVLVWRPPSGTRLLQLAAVVVCGFGAFVIGVGLWRRGRRPPHSDGP